MQVWLRPNQRLRGFELAFYSLLTLLFAWVTWVIQAGSANWVGSGLAGAAALVCLARALKALRQLTTPYLVYRDRDHTLCVCTPGGRRHAIPIEAVECFFLGQSAAGLPSSSDRATEASAVVVRLSEKAQQWHQRDVPAAWGQWCGGYITVRGTWCEPLSLERVSELNHRLAAVRRGLKESRGTG